MPCEQCYVFFKSKSKTDAKKWVIIVIILFLVMHFGHIWSYLTSLFSIYAFLAGINEKTRASNITNAHKNRVIVIHTYKIYSLGKILCSSTKLCRSWNKKQKQKKKTKKKQKTYSNHILSSAFHSHHKVCYLVWHNTCSLKGFVDVINNIT